jgi:hypothetical protein
MLALSVQTVGYTSAFARTSTIKAVAEGVAPDFADKPWTCVAPLHCSSARAAAPDEGRFPRARDFNPPRRALTWTVCARARVQVVGDLGRRRPQGVRARPLSPAHRAARPSAALDPTALPPDDRPPARALAASRSS